MKSGGLEAQRTPDLLFWLMFAIGTEGCILPNRTVTMENHNFNPTQIVLAALCSNVELLWYSRCSSMTIPDIRVNLKRICDVADAHYTELRGLNMILARKGTADCTIKRHLWRFHMPDFYERIGANKYNDSDLPEHGHIEDKAIFKRTSKRYYSNLTEMVNLVSNMTLCILYYSLCLLMFVQT